MTIFSKKWPSFKKNNNNKYRTSYDCLTKLTQISSFNTSFTSKS